MEAVVRSLQRLALEFANESAANLLQRWPAPPASEDFLGTAVHELAGSAMLGHLSLEEREVAIVGLERSLSLAVEVLDPAVAQRLQASVLEQVLQNYDTAGDALAVKASLHVLMPGVVSADVTEALRAMLALLFRYTGAAHLPAEQLLELVRGDVALAVAFIADAIRVRPAGLPHWSPCLVQVLHRLTTPDAFVAMLRLADPTRDFSSMAMEDFVGRQLEHSRALALSFVQFDLLDCMLLAAEDPSQRQMVVAALVRTLHNLTASKKLSEPGRLLSRYVSLDLPRLGFRFLAPLARKLVDDSRSAEAARHLRHICRTLSWLVVHAEYDQNTFLSESLRPLVSEWALRGLARPAPPATIAALLVLAGNCGGLEGRLLAEAQAAAPKIQEDVYQEFLRCVALTAVGDSSLSSLGFATYATARDDDAIEPQPSEDDPGDDSWFDNYFFTEEEMEDERQIEQLVAGILRLERKEPCTECGASTDEGSYGSGYYEGQWYCTRCWKAFLDAEEPGAVTVSRWPLECGVADPREQRGAAALLLSAPAHLRCGISGRLLVSQAMQVPASSETAYPVSFARQSLERWHRRSGGRCPISGHPLDLRGAAAAPHILQEVQCWLTAQRC